MIFDKFKKYFKICWYIFWIFGLVKNNLILLEIFYFLCNIRKKLLDFTYTNSTMFNLCLFFLNHQLYVIIAYFIIFRNFYCNIIKTLLMWFMYRNQIFFFIGNFFQYFFIFFYTFLKFKKLVSMIFIFLHNLGNWSYS